MCVFTLEHLAAPRRDPFVADLGVSGRTADGRDYRSALGLCAGLIWAVVFFVEPRHLRPDGFAELGGERVGLFRRFAADLEVSKRPWAARVRRLGCL